MTAIPKAEHAHPWWACFSFRLGLLIAGLVGLTALSSAQEERLIPLRFQLHWVTQAEFAGYYAAEELGYYAEEGLDVTLLDGSVEIVPQQLVVAGAADLGLGWVPRVLESNENGADLVNIAQMSQRSATLQVAFAHSGIERVEDLRGLRVGAWGFGNEHELFVALRAAGIDPENPDDITIVQQGFDMSLLLNGEVDAAQAMTYNEYAQVLEAVNPDTGELYQPEDLSVIDFNEVGSAMLPDHIFAAREWLEASGQRGGSDRLLESQLPRLDLLPRQRGRMPGVCAGARTDAGRKSPALAAQRNQQADLARAERHRHHGRGPLGPDRGRRSRRCRSSSEEPGRDAYRTDLAQAALDSLALAGLDVIGEAWEPVAVVLRPGGE